MQLHIAGIVTEIGKIYRMGLEMLRVVVDCKTLGMSTPIDLHESLFFGRREVADLKNEIDMSNWDWRWIDWIGNLADKAAILGQRRSKALPRPRWALVKHAGQNALVFGYGLTWFGFRFVVFHGHDQIRERADLTRASAAGVTESEVTPASINSGKWQGTLAMSPQRLTGM